MNGRQIAVRLSALEARAGGATTIHKTPDSPLLVFQDEGGPVPRASGYWVTNRRGGAWWVSEDGSEVVWFGEPEGEWAGFTDDGGVPPEFVRDGEGKIHLAGAGTYFVTYGLPPEGASEFDVSAVYAANDTPQPVTLEEVRETCRTLGVHAKLTDEAGFTKGWVKSDGTYRLV